MFDANSIIKMYLRYVSARARAKFVYFDSNERKRKDEIRIDSFDFSNRSFLRSAFDSVQKRDALRS